MAFVITIVIFLGGCNLGNTISKNQNSTIKAGSHYRSIDNKGSFRFGSPIHFSDGSVVIINTPTIEPLSSRFEYRIKLTYTFTNGQDKQIAPFGNFIIRVDDGSNLLVNLEEVGSDKEKKMLNPGESVRIQNECVISKTDKLQIALEASHFIGDKTEELYSFTIYDMRDYYTEEFITTTSPPPPIPTTSIFNPKKYAKPNYKAYSRDPDKYAGKMIIVTGKILQVVEDGLKREYRIAQDKDASKVWFVRYYAGQGESRILEDDIVTIYGTFGGLYEYTTVLGSSVIVPLIKGEKIILK